MLLVPCTCRPGEKYADGSSPSFHLDPVEACTTWQKKKALCREAIRTQSASNLYFGVHLYGMHLIKT
jgi:hypothetical protein